MVMLENSLPFMILSLRCTAEISIKGGEVFFTVLQKNTTIRIYGFVCTVKQNDIVMEI